MPESGATSPRNTESLVGSDRLNTQYPISDEIRTASGGDRPDAQRVAHQGSHAALFDVALAFEASILPSRIDPGKALIGC
jgi:hypothetical protein